MERKWWKRPEGASGKKVEWRRLVDEGSRRKVEGSAIARAAAPLPACCLRNRAGAPALSRSACGRINRAGGRNACPDPDKLMVPVLYININAYATQPGPACRRGWRV